MIQIAPSTKEFITLGIAVYAAIVATVNYVHTWRRDRNAWICRLKVGFWTRNWDDPAAAPELFVSIRNFGRREITIDGCGWYLPDGFLVDCAALAGDQRFPVTLGSEDRLEVPVAIDELLNQAGVARRQRRKSITFTPVCWDRVGREYRGSRFTIDLDRVDIGRSIRRAKKEAP